MNWQAMRVIRSRNTGGAVQPYSDRASGRVTLLYIGGGGRIYILRAVYLFY